MADIAVHKVYQDLITANHILHNNGIVDPYGHVSVRHPLKPGVYIMAKRLAPGMVQSPDDLIEYLVADSSPLDPNAQVGYSERFIHGEIFKLFPAVNCVVHSHSEDVMPFVIGDVALRPPIHLAGFLGNPVPTFDIVPLYTSEDPKNMLVNNSRFGEGLARTFIDEINITTTTPSHGVVLMRRHGLTAVGNSIAQAVFRAHYTCAAARMLASAMVLRASSTHADRNSGSDGLLYLESDMLQACHEAVEKTAHKAWDIWAREVESYKP